MKPLYPFLIALQFLTRIPIRLREKPTPLAVARSLPYYPLAGLIIGLLVAALNELLMDTAAPLRAALVLTLWVALTGALHLDGLADSADAWFAGAGDRERTLAVMKDPYCGPMAVAAVVLLLLLKFASIQSLSRSSYLALAFIPMLARGMVPLLFATTPYVRAGGSGSALAAGSSYAAGIVAVALQWLVVAIFTGLIGLGLLLSLGAAFIVLRHSMIARLGGTTGDTAGALIEIGETAMLLALVFI